MPASPPRGSGLERGVGGGSHQVGRLDQDHGVVVPAFDERAHHRVIVEPYPIGRDRVLAEQPGRDRTAGHGAIGAHERRHCAPSRHDRRTRSGFGAVRVRDHGPKDPRRCQRITESPQVRLPQAGIVGALEHAFSEVNQTLTCSVSGPALEHGRSRLPINIFTNAVRGTVSGGVTRHCLVTRAERRIAGSKIRAQRGRPSGQIPDRR